MSVLTDEERAELTRLARSKLTTVRPAQRAHIALLRLSNGSTGSIVGACSDLSAVPHPPRPTTHIICNLKSRAWPRDSTKRVFGIPRTISLLRDPCFNKQSSKLGTNARLPDS